MLFFYVCSSDKKIFCKENTQHTIHNTTNHLHILYWNCINCVIKFSEFTVNKIKLSLFK